MSGLLHPTEEAQLTQTIEMFEVITQSQPTDYQSLEILKEAYSKLGRENDVIRTSKRIAQAYVQMGQLSSAILEYESILQLFPDDPDVQAALKQIESRASSFAPETALAEPAVSGRSAPPVSAGPAPSPKAADKPPPREFDDGRRTMHRIFVEGKLITAADFEQCWSTPDLLTTPNNVSDPFIQTLSDKGIFPVDKALKLLSDKSRWAFLPISQYEIDSELARGFPVAVCRRWCVLPFDRLSKSVLVATANPFNQQAARDLAEATKYRLVWYLAAPNDLVANLRKVFR
jgi:tetratricopeptide (TPR) repeat protein